MKQRILFLTTLNLATNPRLVKEIRLALELKMAVIVICFRFNNWSNDLNDSLLNEFKDINIIQIDAERSSFFSWFFSVVSEKIFRTLSKWISLPLSWQSTAITRRSQLLVKALNKIKHADYVIGHNPGAIYPAYKAAQQFSCKSGFDIEDYHPGEGNDIHLQGITLSLMKKLFPKFNYVSFASASIFNQCIQTISNFNKQTSLVLNNSFPQHEFIEPIPIIDKKLQLVWFSQHIDKGRGLEQIIPIVDKHSDKMNLTLFGNCNPNFKQDFIAGKKGIHLGGILPQQQLHQQLAKFDAGLAIEPGKDLNNELALSNKVFAYLQAGLFVLATETIEQKRYLEQMHDAGVLVKKNFENAEEVLLQLQEDIVKLRTNMVNRFQNAKSLSWENASSALAKIWTT
jgi:hypothetical protein